MKIIGAVAFGLLSRKIHTFADLTSGFEFRDTTLFQGRLELIAHCLVHVAAPAEPNGRGVRQAYALTFTSDSTTPVQHIWTYVSQDSATAC